MESILELIWMSSIFCQQFSAQFIEQTRQKMYKSLEFKIISSLTVLKNMAHTK